MRDNEHRNQQHTQQVAEIGAIKARLSQMSQALLSTPPACYPGNPSTVGGGNGSLPVIWDYGPDSGCPWDHARTYGAINNQHEFGHMAHRKVNLRCPEDLSHLPLCTEFKALLLQNEPSERSGQCGYKAQDAMQKQWWDGVRLNDRRFPRETLQQLRRETCVYYDSSVFDSVKRAQSADASLYRVVISRDHMLYRRDLEAVARNEHGVQFATVCCGLNGVETSNQDGEKVIRFQLNAMTQSGIKLPIILLGDSLNERDKQMLKIYAKVLKEKGWCELFPGGSIFALRNKGIFDEVSDIFNQHAPFAAMVHVVVACGIEMAHQFAVDPAITARPGIVVTDALCVAPYHQADQWYHCDDKEPTLYQHLAWRTTLLLTQHREVNNTLMQDISRWHAVGTQQGGRAVDCQVGGDSTPCEMQL